MPSKIQKSQLLEALLECSLIHHTVAQSVGKTTIHMRKISMIGLTPKYQSNRDKITLTSLRAW